jgi:hypothetical protein
MKTTKTILALLSLLGLFVLPQAVWAAATLTPGVYCRPNVVCPGEAHSVKISPRPNEFIGEVQKVTPPNRVVKTPASDNRLIYGKIGLEHPPFVVEVPEPENCSAGDACDDHDDCTDDFCSLKAGGADFEIRVGRCQHTPNDHCGGPPLSYKVQPVDVPASEPPVEQDPPIAETPVETPETAPAPEPTPAPEPAPSVDLKFDCGAASEDTIEIDGRDVIFAIERNGKRTHVTLEAIPVANGSTAALATLLNDAEKIELTQTGGSELVLMKGDDLENDAALTSDAVLVDANGKPGLVPTNFAFDSPIPVAPDWSGVEVYSFTAKLVDGEGRTLATAVADCRIGLQIKGGGGMGGCSLTDGEFESKEVFGMFGIFLAAWGILCLAERFKSRDR